MRIRNFRTSAHGIERRVLLVLVLLSLAAFALVGERLVDAQQGTPVERPVATDDDIVDGTGCGWTPGTAYPITIADAASVTIGSNIYVFGGYSNGVRTTSAYRFNGATWTQIASLPEARSSAAIATDGTFAYIINGTTAGVPATARLIRYDPASNTYTNLAPPPTATAASAAVWHAGRIYRIAGDGGAGQIASVEAYNIATNTWSQVANFPVAVIYPSAINLSVGGFFAGGGLAAGNIDSVKTYLYNPSNNTWNDGTIADLPASPAPHWGSSSAVYGNNWVLGPGASNGAIQSTVIQWDPVVNIWSDLPNTPQARYRGVAGVIGNNYYTIGGNPFTGTTDNQRLICTGAGMLQFSAPATNVNEGNSAQVTVQRVNGSSGRVSINFFTSNNDNFDSAINNVDYTDTYQALTWLDGDSSSRVVNVPTIQDTIYEPTENFTPFLSYPTGGASLGLNVNQVNITDNESPPVFALSPAPLSQNEGSGGGTTAFVFNVDRTFLAGTTATAFSSNVNFSIVGTGVNPAGIPSDVTNGGGNLSFNPGGPATLQAVANVVADNVQEPNETFNVQLTSATNATFNNTPVGGTIINDDLGVLVVTNTNDSGPGSLRQAITDANNQPGADTVTFDIQPPGPKTIAPVSALPIITSPVTINAQTQPGWVSAPIIELSGLNTVGAVGLYITAGNSTVRGLVINRFSQEAIRLETNGSNIIQGNYIGTNAAGSAPLGNVIGIAAYSGSISNLIGGSSAGQPNLISGNNIGVVVSQAFGFGNQIVGNFIGTNAAGTAGLGNPQTGILISNGANTIVGGTVAGARNVISGNGVGIEVTGGGSTGVQIQGNYIGTNSAGTGSIPNTFGIITRAPSTTIGGTTSAARNVISGNNARGVYFDPSATGGVMQGNFVGITADGFPLANSGAIEIDGSNNLIGGTVFGAGNAIFNSRTNTDGIDIAPAGTGNAILGNNIFANGSTTQDLGIDLENDGITSNDTEDGDSGANNRQNFPVLTSATSNGQGGATIQGTLNSVANTTFRLEFFSNQSCDASGNGEGQIFLGTANVSTDGSGNAPINTTVTTASPGFFITSTATRLVAGVPRDTSEFSACRAYSSGATISFNTSTAKMTEPVPTGTPITITFSGGAFQAASAQFTMSNGTATGGASCAPGVDYINNSQFLDFGPNGNTPNPFSPTITICNDTVVEGQETVNLTLSNFSGASPGAIINAVLTINSDDTTSVTIALDAPTSVPEDGAANLTYRVVRGGTIAGIIFVNLDISGDATFADSDYDLSSPCLVPLRPEKFGPRPFVNPLSDSPNPSRPAGGFTLQFADGQAQCVITVNPTADTKVETDESVVLSLQPGSGYTVGAQPTATGFIQNDDTSVRVNVNSAAVFEDGPLNLFYTFTRTGVTTNQLSVNFSVSGGVSQCPAGASCIVPDDVVLTSPGTTHQGTSGSVVFGAGNSTVTLTADPIADSIPEADEQLIISVVGGAGYTIGSPPSATALILNDDGIDACSPRSISYNQTVKGLLTGSSCLIAGNRTDVYSFTGAAGDRIVISMSSDQIYTGIALIDPANNTLQTPENDSFRDSRLPGTGFITLPLSGTYIIRARGLFGGRGPYKLTLYSQPSTPCAYSFIPRTDVPFTGGTYTVYVATQPNCPPLDSPPVDGAVYRNLSYRDSLITFDVPAHTGAAPRTDTIPIGTGSHLINQYGNGRPPNDDFADAGLITGSSSRPASPDEGEERSEASDAPAIGFNTSATCQPTEPKHAGTGTCQAGEPPPGRSVWYRWTPPTTGLHTFATSGSSFDTILAVYACPSGPSCTLANIIPVTSNNDATSFDATSKVNFRATAGTTYMIAVDGNLVNGVNQTGTIVLSWRSYERLYRVYLQNYNGRPSSFEPASVRARNTTNPEIVATALKLSLGVYEISLPADGAAYRLEINGPASITWDPNNFLLEDDPSNIFRRGQNSISYAQWAVSVPPGGPDGRPEADGPVRNDTIRSIVTGELELLSATLGSAAFTDSAHPHEPCGIGSATLSRQGVEYAVYQCVLRPETSHWVFPKRTRKRFMPQLHRYNYINAGSNPSTLAPIFEASNSDENKRITARAAAGGDKTRITISYNLSTTVTFPDGSPPIVTDPEPVKDTKEAGPDGSFTFSDLEPGILYSITAKQFGFTHTAPESVTLGGTDLTVDVPGAPCQFNVGALQPIPSGGDTNLAIPVTVAPAQCDWYAESNNDWIIKLSAEAVGDKTIFFRILPNPNPGPRSGSIRITGRPQVITINQDGNSTGMANLEGDIVDANGTLAGDGLVFANDVSVLRTAVISGAQPFATGSAHPNNQFQRADINGGCGNGALDIGDVAFIRQLALQLATPPAACGPTAPTANSEARPGPGASQGQPMLSIISKRAARGTTVSIPIELDAARDIVAFGADLNFDPDVFEFVSLALAAGTSSDSVLSVNSSEAEKGRIRMLLDSAGAIVSTRRSIAYLELRIKDHAPMGDHRITLDGDQTNRSFANTSGELIAGLFAGGIVTVEPIDINQLDTLFFFYSSTMPKEGEFGMFAIARVGPQ